MNTELLKESWEKRTQCGYTLNCPAPEVVNIITPTGYSTQLRLKKTPKLCPLRAVISALLRFIEVAQTLLSIELD